MGNEDEDCGYRPPSSARAGCRCGRCKRVRERLRKRKRERYANDPEYRERRLERERERWREKRENANDKEQEGYEDFLNSVDADAIIEEALDELDNNDKENGGTDND